MSIPYVFISYSRQDNEFVRRLIADLEAEGIRVWIDQQGLQVGTPSWERAIRDAIRATDAVVLIASPDSGQSRYVRGELIVAEMYKRPVYPVWAAGEMWAECVPLGLIEMQHTDARANKYAKALLDLLTALRNVPSAADEKQSSESVVDPDFTPRNPYKGLRAFTGSDTDDFFGRDSLVKELVEAVSAASKSTAPRFLAIVGPSGSGKSSVVMAGLLPKLQSGALTGSKEWVYLDPVLPGAQPLESLAVILADALHMANSDVLKDLDANARGLHLLARRLTKGRNDAHVVLLVDQFEELFTQTMDADKRDHFIDLLVTAATESGGQLLIILTLRADFYDRPMNYADLGKLLEQHTKSVLPMSIEDLRDVIEKPAALPDVKLEFEPGLVGDLLFEVRGQTGALPLLQFTLDQLAERRQGRKLTTSAYQDMGGVKGALAKHAEAIYQSLRTDQHRELARSLFLRLIEPGATEQDTTRRRAAQSELVTSDPHQTELLREVSAAFVNARLLTTNVIAGLAVIEVSHEALIREWEQLVEWLKTAREDVRLQHDISRDTEEWIRQNRNPDYIAYGSEKLNKALDWASRNAPSRDENEFLEMMQKTSSERSQAINTLEKRVRELDMLSQVSQAVNFAIEFDDLLELINAQITRVIDAPCCYIALHDEITNSLHFEFFVEDDERFQEKEHKRWSVTDDLFSIVFSSRQPWAINSFPETDKNRDTSPAYISSKLQKWMAVPLLAGGKTLGVLAVGSYTRDKLYDDDDLKIFMNIGFLSATSMEKSRLFTQANLRVRQLNALNLINQQLTLELNLDNLLDLITTSAMEMLKGTKGSLLLITDDDTHLEFKVVVGDTSTNLVGKRLPKDYSGLAGQVVSTGSPITVNNHAAQNWEFRNVENDSHEYTNTTALIAAPLTVKNRVIGVLEVINKPDGEPFLSEDVELLMLFAGQAAIAIENARLFQQNDFLAEMVHELRTPLAALKASTSLLQRPKLPEDKRAEITQLMQSETERLMKLTSEYLDFAQLESGRAGLEFTQFNLDELVFEVVSITRPQAKENQLDVTMMSKSSGMSVWADRDKLKQVLLTLVVNAMEYNQAGGQIVIQINPDNSSGTQQAHIAVVDTGQGITPDQQPHVFDKFYVIPGGKSVSSGLGLAIAKNIIEKHQGQIWFESQPNEGSIFHISLPIDAREK